jgi:hypothetical protein
MPDKPEKNRIWLLLGLITISATVVAYAFQEDIVYLSNGSVFAYSVLLILLVVMTLFFVMCYRNPVLGEKIIGRAPDVEHSEKDKTSFVYTGFTKSQSAKDEKILHSKRKRARSSRKHYAAVTREMQDSEKSSDSSQE